MTDEPKGRGAAVFAVGLFLVLGVVLGLLAYAGVYWFQHPAAGTPGTLEHVRQTDWLGFPQALFVVVGGLLGVMASGSIKESRLTARVARAARSLFIFILGGLLGAIFGTGIYLAFWISGNSQSGLRDAFAHLFVAASDPADPLGAFLAAGGITGFVVAAYLRGGQLVRRASQLVAGAVVGALAGIVIYSFAYVVVYYPQIPSSGNYIIHFAEAIYSFTAVELFFAGMGATVGLRMAKY